MGIKSCIQSWWVKLGVTTLSSSERKEVLMSATDENISYLSTKVTTAKGKNKLKLKVEIITEKSKNTLKLKVKIITEELKIKFVVVPIDKTSDKNIFVC